MIDFLVKHKLINTSQHGFLKARSCLTNLLCFFEEITKWVDDGSPVDVIYLDFQKWSEKWQLLFNFGKCKCLHIGPGNTSITYEMGGTILSIT